MSLLITVSKVLEKIIYSRVYTFLNESGQIFRSQYGFRSKHSCEHAIAELVGNIVKGKEKNEHTIAIFLDLSKAFDTQEHETLFRKLEIYGIRGVALNWFSSYLSNRSMHAKCNINCSTHLSHYKDITFGTPQGSCLGPLLFLIFCNDLYYNLELTHCILFTDDTTIYNSHKDIKYLKWTIEHDLAILNDWFKANKLTLNTNKTVGMLFKSKSLKHVPSELKIDSDSIRFGQNVKFLGVWIDQDLTWKAHTSKLILKIQQNSHLLFKSKRHLNVHAKKILYYAQIYSHLACSLSVLGPMAPKNDIRKLESLQAKCLQCISNNNYNSSFHSYTSLIKLELAKFGWKLKNCQLPTALQECAQTNQCGKMSIKSHRYTTRNKGIPNIPHTASKHYSNSIFCRSISYFYTLPSEIKTINNYRSFCRKMKLYLL